MYFAQHLVRVPTHQLFNLSKWNCIQLQLFQECQLDDSGTESDDETEKDDVDDVESEDGDISKSIPQNKVLQLIRQALESV